MKQETFIPQQQIKEMFSKVRSILEPLALNPGAPLKTSIGFSAETEHEAYIMSRLLKIATDFGIDPVTSTLLTLAEDHAEYDRKNKRASVSIDPTTSDSTTWYGAIESARNRLNFMESAFIRENAALERNHNAAQEQLAREQEARKAAKLAQQDRAEAEAHKNRVAAAQKPQRPNVTPSLTVFAQQTPPSHLRDEAPLIKQTIEKLAGVLDVRSDETLALAGADDATRATAAMHSTLAGMLLSQDNIRRTTHTVGLTKFFGGLNNGYEAKIEKTVNSNADYLREHPEAQAFLREQAQESPGLILLVQAALTRDLSSYKEQAEEYLKNLKEIGSYDEHANAESSSIAVLPALDSLFTQHLTKSLRKQ